VMLEVRENHFERPRREPPNYPNQERFQRYRANITNVVVVSKMASNAAPPPSLRKQHVKKHIYIHVMSTRPCDTLYTPYGGH
jgi:hypothetical protein